MVPKEFQTITGLGNCPSDWLVKTADELTSKITKGTTPPKTEIVSDSKIPFLRVNNLGFNGELDTSSDMIFVTQEAHNGSLARSIAYPGDILMNIVGPPLGKIAMLGRDFDEYNMNQAIVIYRTVSSKVNKDYFLNFLSSELAQQWLQSRSKKTSGQQNLTIQLCKELPVPTPPLPEQQKIAKILSTWDKAISTTERLIENSNQQKKALMHQLLTGKKRLLDESGKRFEGEWKERKLSNLGSTFNGLTGKTKVDFGSGKKYIPYMNIFKNTFIDTDNLDYVNIDVDEKQNTVQFGDVFFTTSSETPEEVGMSSVLLKKTKEPIYLNSFCFGFRLFEIDKIAPAFIGYILRSSHVRRKIAILAQGATRYNLSKVQLLKISIALPSLEEQQKIATVLTNADKEIELFEQQLADLQQEKKALMQVLLTGKKRVTVI
ncbi:type I restriction endonuclease subunit S [Psychrobacter glaciei]|uniref:Type I restriction endonuclease subunit S n=1 Tax=Psychrobacter glaciei TaxID=619771 RepID=A0ABQ3GVA6_9GAMM|nr:restriction endonuclease subunit S [Psychrobacter glaciei]GHD35799.1 type I restriction endonuclease subunit S [Psychrobacter glaciei]